MVLKGQVALVTGAAQGIGAAIVLELARMGATVIGTDINEDGANRINAALAEAGAQGRGLVMDVRDAAQIDGLTATLQDNGIPRRKGVGFPAVNEADIGP